MTEHSVSQHLRIEIRNYDETIRRFIPDYEQMVDRAVAAVAPGGPGLVLDLGAGTGALSERLLRRTDLATVELWDVDPAMLATARERLASFGNRARFRSASFHDPLPRAHGIMASLALHHVRDPEAKAGLYLRLAEALEPGCAFANADVTIPTETHGYDQAFRIWADHLVASGIPEERAWQHFEAWSAEDRYFSLDQELEWLAAAGLEPAVEWQSGPSTLIVAKKPK